MAEKIIYSNKRKELIEQQAVQTMKEQFQAFPEQWEMVEEIFFCHRDKLFPKGSIVYYQEKAISIAFFAFSCENIEKENQLDTFYVHMCQSAYLNAIRSQIAALIREEKRDVPSYESELRGPGFGDVDLNELSYYCEQSEASSIGVTVKENHLCPEQSCVGSILFSDDARMFDTYKTGCASCRSTKENCFLCIFGKNRMKGNNEKE